MALSSLQTFCDAAVVSVQEGVAVETVQHQNVLFSSLSLASERDYNCKYKCTESLMLLRHQEINFESGSFINEDVVKWHSHFYGSSSVAFYYIKIQYLT